MSTERIPANSPIGPRYWRGTIAGAVVAAFISLAVTWIGVSLSWPHPSAISLGVFLFLIPVLPRLFSDRPGTWPRALTFGLVAAIIGGYVAALLD
jgi:MFS superfamily sulfate permease-like transporter